MPDEWLCQWIWGGEVCFFLTLKVLGRHSIEVDSNIFKSVFYQAKTSICGLSMAVKPFGFTENVL